MSVTAYHSFGGEVEASNTPTIRRLTPSRRDQLSCIAPASETAATVVKAVSEIVEATKSINEDLESYIRLVVSNSMPIRRQPMPVALMEIPGNTGVNAHSAAHPVVFSRRAVEAVIPSCSGVSD